VTVFSDPQLVVDASLLGIEVVLSFFGGSVILEGGALDTGVVLVAFGGSDIMVVVVRIGGSDIPIFIEDEAVIFGGDADIEEDEDMEDALAGSIISLVTKSPLFSKGAAKTMPEVARRTKGRS